MSYTNITFSTYSAELWFINSFIEAITSIDSRLTASTNDMTAEYSQTDTPPTFDLLYNGNPVINFTRAAKSNITSNQYVLKSPGALSGLALTFSQQVFRSDQATARTFTFKVATNSNVLSLLLGGYASDIVASFVGFSTNTTSGTSVVISNTLRAISQSFVLSDGTSAKKADRIPYLYDTNNNTNVEIIKSKVFMPDNSAEKKLAINSLYDISTVPQETIINIGGKKYYSLDSHTVMEV